MEFGDVILPDHVVKFVQGVDPAMGIQLLRGYLLGIRD